MFRHFVIVSELLTHLLLAKLRKFLKLQLLNFTKLLLLKC